MTVALSNRSLSPTSEELDELMAILANDEHQFIPDAPANGCSQCHWRLPESCRACQQEREQGGIVGYVDE